TGEKHFNLVFSIAEANADGHDRMQAAIGADGRLTIVWRDMQGQKDVATVLAATGFAAPATGQYAYDADATDVDGDTLTYSLGTAPSGATIDPATGVVRWTPHAP